MPHTRGLSLSQRETTNPGADQGGSCQGRTAAIRSFCVGMIVLEPAAMRFALVEPCSDSVGLSGSSITGNMGDLGSDWSSLVKSSMLLY